MSALKIKLLSDKARVPTRKTDGSVGFDLYSTINILLPPREKTCIPIGIAIEFTGQYYGIVKSRSGLSLRYNIEVGAGVIDTDYRGEINVLLYNHSDDVFIINEGERVAQLLIFKREDIIFDISNELNETERGASGFGSTGML